MDVEASHSISFDCAEVHQGLHLVLGRQVERSDDAGLVADEDVRFHYCDALDGTVVFVVLLIQLPCSYFVILELDEDISQVVEFIVEAEQLVRGLNDLVGDFLILLFVLLDDV